MKDGNVFPNQHMLQLNILGPKDWNQIDGFKIYPPIGIKMEMRWPLLSLEAFPILMALLMS